MSSDYHNFHHLGPFCIKMGLQWKTNQARELSTNNLANFFTTNWKPDIRLQSSWQGNLLVRTWNLDVKDSEQVAIPIFLVKVA